MSEREIQRVLRHNRRRIALNKLIMRKRRFFASIRSFLNNNGSVSAGGYQI